MHAILKCLLVGAIAGCVLAGCEDRDPPPPALPVNPEIAPDPLVGRGEMWDFSIKTWDQSFRIRWPSTLGRAPHGIGPGSWVIVNDLHRAEFRSFDTDHGAMRPSYTMPLTTPVEYPATAILYAADGTRIAWFRTEGPNRSGRLP